MADRCGGVQRCPCSDRRWRPGEGFRLPGVALGELAKHAHSTSADGKVGVPARLRALIRSGTGTGRHPGASGSDWTARITLRRFPGSEHCARHPEPRPRAHSGRAGARSAQLTAA